MLRDKSSARTFDVSLFLLPYKKYETIGAVLLENSALPFESQMLEDYQGPPGSTDSSVLDPVDLNTKLKANIK